MDLISVGGILSLFPCLQRTPAACLLRPAPCPTGHSARTTPVFSVLCGLRPRGVPAGRGGGGEDKAGVFSPSAPQARVFSPSAPSLQLRGAGWGGVGVALQAPSPGPEPSTRSSPIRPRPGNRLCCHSSQGTTFPFTLQSPL